MKFSLFMMPLHDPGRDYQAVLKDDREAIELELQTYFEEAPLDVIPLQITHPVRVSVALYVTPQRTPGFASEPVVTATVTPVIFIIVIRTLPATAVTVVI